MEAGQALDDKPIETFDNLFEPFRLEEGSAGSGQDPAETEPEIREVRHDAAPTHAAARDPQTVACVSCGSANPTFNRHCEACGARLSQVPLPVAPQPMLKTTAGARALTVLATVLLAVAVLALVVNVFRGGDDVTATSTSVTTTLPITPNIEELFPIRADCSSELAAWPCSALYDDDKTNSWNATEGGIGTEITFLFSPPVQITEMFIHNLKDEGRFQRNARMRGLEITIDDLKKTTVVELDDTNDPQKVQIRSLRTSSLTIRITSAYPGQSFDGLEPFRELAAQEILFFGRPSPQVGS